VKLAMPLTLSPWMLDCLAWRLSLTNHESKTPTF